MIDEKADGEGYTVLHKCYKTYMKHGPIEPKYTQ